MSKVRLTSTNYFHDSKSDSELDETARLPAILRKPDASNDAANDSDFSLSDKLVERVEQLFSLTESIERRLDGISKAIDAKPSRARQAKKKKTGVSAKKKTAAKKKKTVARKKKSTVARKKKTSASK